MANKKISELPYIDGGKISGNTLVPLVTYFSASTGDTVHTYITDLQNYLTSGVTVSGDFLPLSGGTVSGGTQFTVGLTANTISATTYQNLPSATFSGGTVTGPTNFTNGLTANTISATTYQNLPTDIRVTGGTYSAGTISFTNNTGGTFNVTGLTTGSTSTVSGNFLPLSGGTVTGGTIFTSGLTINYIDFDTTPTVPNPTGGTLYYDSTENALSYKPITPSNDVTVNLGQESLIRIYNNSGVQINNGQALHITGATSGSPTVSLAIGTGGDSVQFQISGIATHDIPNSSFGFMTVFGVVRDLNLTAFTVGEQIYLSQTVPGGLSSYSGLSITGRTCEVGHILDNSASGKLQVAILNEIEGTIITTQENNILAANNSSTGIFEFSGLSISTPSGTTFNVGPVDGWIIDNVTSPTNPTIQLITYSGSTGNTALYVSSATETYILLTSGLTLTQQTTFPTPQQRRQNLYLGKFGHANRQYLINAFNEPDSSLSPVSQLRDMFTPIRLINEGVIVSANGANLNINTSAGVLYGLGLGYITNKLNPNSLSVSGTSPCTFQYRTQTGGTASNTTLITPGVYDNNGVVTSVGGGSNASTNQRIYLVQNGQFRIQYGQQVYGSLTAAIEASQNEAFTTFSNFRDNATLIGILSVNKNATNLSNTTQARFLLTSKFGETVGAAGGVSTTTLQQAYDNSTTPEITTNSTLGPLSVKNGAGTLDNVTNVFEGVNATGTTTSIIRADGLISGSTISTPSFTANTNGVTTTTISATTYQNLPSGNLVVGTTQITSGTSGNVLFQTGTTLQQNSNLYWDNTNSRLSIGQGSSPSARLDVRAQGVLSTDIVFRVRNNGDTANLISQQGDGLLLIGTGSAETDDALIRARQSTINYFKLSSQGGVAIGSGSTISAAGSNNTAIAIGSGSQSRAYFGLGGGVSVGGSTYADANSIAIGTLAKAGLSAGGSNSSISIGYNAQTNASGGDRGIAIGSNASGGLGNSDVTAIGTSVIAGSFTNVRNTLIGQYITGANSQTDMIVLGGGTGTGASAAQPTLINSFSVYLGNTERSLFVNKNSNVVLRSLQSLTSGTNFDASATNTITIHSGTTPTTNITDAFQQYSADITAGNAAPHFRTENGSVIKLYQNANTVSIDNVLVNIGLRASGGTSNFTNGISATTISATTFNLSGSQIDTLWTSYVPTWTASSVDPVLNNGTIEGYYKLIGKTCFVRGNIVMGSTTTFGTGEWYISMPFTAVNADAILMTANLLDNGSAWYNATLNGARSGFNTRAPLQYVNIVNGTATDVNATQPFTWATSDRFIWNGSYEIA
jgi:hypothetical protein